MVTAANIVFHLTGGQTGPSNINGMDSLGGAMAAPILSDKFNNLWDDVTDKQRLQGATEYRWIVVENTASDTLVNPHFYFSPKDPFIEIELSRLALGAPVNVLETEEDRPTEAEIGPEEDVPMPFTKTGESYDTTQTIGPDIPPNGKLYVCIRREIPKESERGNSAYVLLVAGSPSIA